MEESKNIEDMTPVQILQEGHPLLRSRSQEITIFDENLEALAGVMNTVMRKARGIGLSAVQLGIPVRLITIGEGVLGEETWALVNPKIVKRAGEQRTREGCLSISKGKWWRAIKRSLRVVVEYQDLTGAPQKVKAHGLLAAALQHELDHLDGVLFTDYVPEEEKKEMAPRTKQYPLINRAAKRAIREANHG